MNGKPKRIVIQFACTAKEKRAIQRAAKGVQFSVSHWLKRRAFHDDVVSPATDPESMIRQVAR